MSKKTRNRKPLRIRPEMELLEARVVPAAFRSIDGTGNNAAHPQWGSTDEALLRVGPVRYGDGISTPAPQGGVGRPSARVISNTIVAEDPEGVDSDRQLSAMIYAWGQFIDHDMDLTTSNPNEPLPIRVPRGDPFFDPNGTGTQVIDFNRSISVPGTGTSTSNPRQQPNQITAFLDASMVYGSSDAVARQLRTFSGGRLKTSNGGLNLPLNNRTFFPNGAPPTDNNGPLPDSQMFVSGDVRTNENVELTSLHTVFVREHNRIAAELQANNPNLSDEQIYQRAAHRQVGAEIQAITYNEWIPAMLGSNALPAYTGYKANVNPGIATEFSAALFRLGHSLLGNDVEFLGNDGNPVAEEIPLFEAFFNPQVIQDEGISEILKYLASDPSSELDNTIVDSVRNFLFGPPGAGGFDLSSLNIQRTRDHGIANYNDVRAGYGLPRVTSFAQISSDPEIQDKLRELYQNVNNIDLWVGALSEDHVPGTSTGPLIRQALIDQFTRLRDGDSFFYKNPNMDLPFSAADQRFLETNRTLADLIRLNTDADVIQDNIFFIRTAISGEVFNDLDRDGRHDSGEPGLAGRTMNLYFAGEDEPELIATTKTDANGRYRFDYFNGLLVGDYVVEEVVPSGWRTTSTNPRTVNIPRGETFLDVDFGNARTAGLSALNGGAGGGGPMPAGGGSGGFGSTSGTTLFFLAPTGGSMGTTTNPTSAAEAPAAPPVDPLPPVTEPATPNAPDTTGPTLALFPATQEPGSPGDLFLANPIGI